MQSKREGETWSKPVRLVNNFQDDLLLSETLRDSLSLIGWPLPWETWHDSTGVFHFALEHPGKRYVVDYTFDDQVARVQEIPKGFWGVFNSLHAAGGIPNSTYMHAWMWYVRITVVLVVFSVLLGICIWYDGRRDKKTGWYMLLISLFLSLAWMIQLYYYG